MKAVRSVNVSKKSGGIEKDTLKGTVADASLKQNLTSVNVVGMNIGTTLNMGNYESMRIDAWGLEEIKPDETREDSAMRLKDDLIRIISRVQSEISDEVNS